MSDAEQRPERRPSSSAQVRIGPGQFLITSDDDYLGDLGASFEPHMCRLFQSLVKADHNVLDVGANIGCTTLLFGQIANHVDSFEPSPSTFAYLKLNVDNARLNNVTLHNCGLGRSNESLTLTFAPSNRSGGFVSNKTQAGTGHTVESVAIKKGDDLFRDRKIDFIKIDVEGFEKDVIEGLREVITRNHPTVTLELNHWCLNAFQRISIPDFFDFLLDIFPILYAVDGDRYADLRDNNDRYSVMYQHIIHRRYPDLVGAFEERQVAGLIRTLSRSLVSTSDAAISRDSAMAALDAAIAERDCAIAERDAILNSTSWKLTRPLRWLKDFVR